MLGGRQRDVHHGGVQHHHQLGQADDAQDQPATARHLVGVGGPRWPRHPRCGSAAVSDPRNHGTVRVLGHRVPPGQRLPIRPAANSPRASVGLPRASRQSRATARASVGLPRASRQSRATAPSARQWPNSLTAVLILVIVFICIKPVASARRASDLDWRSLTMLSRLSRRGIVLAVVAVTAGVSAAACSSTSAATSSGGQVVAVGAENQYANVIGQIGGKYVRVSAIESNPNTDPHTFEASPSVANAVSSAQLVVQNGIGYDTIMNKIESAAPSTTRKVIVVQNLLGLPDSTPNPHLWYSPRTMPAVARAVAADLSKMQP